MSSELARQQMVEQQIRTWDVFDADILSTFKAVPRDRFVPKDCADVAYADTEIPLAHGQCMLRPSIVGRLLQALAPQATDDVLEIGTGTGYLTACLANLAHSVTSIDIHDDFIATATKNLSDAGVDNVSMECMDVMSELPDGMFDVIAMTCAVPEYHDAYTDLLKPGGRLFLIAGDHPVKSALLVSKDEDGNIEMAELFETDAPEMVNSETEKVFLF
tara:strand:+ start:473 stop:1123 length:651 start_codon:yes stop_codon:yes gene_type:complete